MNEEDKQLLIKDLCARLPYGVKIHFIGNQIYKGEDETLFSINIEEEYINEAFTLELIKPYLFPMSSMTEKQKEELLKLSLSTILNDSLMLKVIDWYNEHHVDYRGLIEKNLALDATNLNIY